MVNGNNDSVRKLENIQISSLEHRTEFLIKGSESFIYSGSFIDNNVVIKERKSKKYRSEKLDYDLRIQRLRIEARMIKSALKSLILVPSLYNVNLSSFSLQLEKIEGQNLGFIIANSISETTESLLPKFFSDFGTIVAKLHNIEIIHGDLTPLNIIIDNDNNIYIIDFGLSYYSNEIKDKAMDLFILFGALKIYPQQNDELFNLFLNGYKIVNEYNSIIGIFDKLTKKGRYK